MEHHLGTIIALMGGVTLAGFFVGRLGKKIYLPSVVGYMLVGVVLGPSLIHLLTSGKLTGPLGQHEMEAVDFITRIALGCVAFSIGSELEIKSLKRLGIGIVSIILGSSFLAFFLVLGGVLLYTKFFNGGVDWPMALVFAAMAPATAPAGTVAVILEYRAKGSLTRALYAVVGFDDGLAIIIYGFAASIAKMMLLREAGAEGGFWSSIVEPFKEIGISLVIGVVIGYLFCFIIQRFQKAPEIFLILFGTILLTTGLAMKFHGSLILANMVIGFVMCNTRKETFVKRVTSPILTVMPFLFIMFFGLAGAHLDLTKLLELGGLGVVYVMMRSAGKVFGANMGAMVGDMNENVRKWCGLAILAQAGVAIGLSLIVAADFRQIAEVNNFPRARVIGVTLLTTITASCIFFEIIGPILTKIALTKSGEINKAGER